MLSDIAVTVLDTSWLAMLVVEVGPSICAIVEGKKRNGKVVVLRVVSWAALCEEGAMLLEAACDKKKSLYRQPIRTAFCRPNSLSRRRNGRRHSGLNAQFAAGCWGLELLQVRCWPANAGATGWPTQKGLARLLWRVARCPVLRRNYSRTKALAGKRNDLNK